MNSTARDPSYPLYVYVTARMLVFEKESDKSLRGRQSIRSVYEKQPQNPFAKNITVMK